MANGLRPVVLRRLEIRRGTLAISLKSARAAPFDDRESDILAARAKLISFLFRIAMARWCGTGSRLPQGCHQTKSWRGAGPGDEQEIFLKSC